MLTFLTNCEAKQKIFVYLLLVALFFVSVTNVFIDFCLSKTNVRALINIRVCEPFENVSTSALTPPPH